MDKSNGLTLGYLGNFGGFMWSVPPVGNLILKIILGSRTYLNVMKQAIEMAQIHST